MAKQTVKNALSDKRQLLKLALNALIESWRADASKFNFLIHGMLPASTTSKLSIVNYAGSSNYQAAPFSSYYNQNGYTENLMEIIVNGAASLYNKEVKILMEQIENWSNNHNNKLADFLGSVENTIIEKVFTKDSVVISDFTEYKDPKQDNGYSLTNILNYYKQEATYPHKDLKINKESGTVRFQILIEDTYVNPLAISTNEKQLCSIKKKLEGELKSDIVDSLKGFLREGREITDLYNDKFVPEIKNLIVEIEDEGQLKGGCGLSYCPK